MGISLADVFSRFAPAYQQRYPAALLPSHRRAIRDILACHTPALGGHLWRCAQCDKDVYVYHGCRNRACPACHAAQTQQWLADRQQELLPCPYFHLTATVPEGLRDLFRSNQKVLYDLLMSLTAQCVMEVAANPRHLGASPGILAVLHTWTGTLTYHPHVHCLVTGGGVSPDGKEILAMDNQNVTFQYKDRKANRQRTCRLEGTEFVRRYLQHVLPRGFHKVRYYGLWNPKRRGQLEQVRLLLQLQQPPDPGLPRQPPDQPSAMPLLEPFKPFRPLCPCCGGELAHIGEIPRPRCRGP